ncbi:hypothetical protein R3W88_033285 [Solanum pinnatisectum]|uniref:Uncharacterized protein n=1 Tax=Solanum pinnatisectum TaxID=50273 RepID=A0AAV9K1E1_9SOLN|nr:hypothetical protein R3W88_033285 [Solanum pinnatisectum]
MSSITISNETIHGIVRRVKRISSPFLTETQNQLTSPSSLIWEREPSTGWEARHQVSGLMRITKWCLTAPASGGSVRGGASGFQCTASKIRTSLPADHCRPILE